MKKRNQLLGLLGTTALLLAACGGQKAATDESVDKKSQTGAADTFTYAISGDPTSLNPINTSDRWGLTVTNMIYSPLVRVEGDGTLKNELAQDVKTSEDGLTVTVDLKPDIKWSDGQPLTADDVVFTYEQKVKKENGNADSLWVADKPITVEKVDDDTVDFKLPSVSGAAVNNIATETYIIPKHIFEKEADFSVNELSAKPVGTGPYKLTEYKRGEYLRFEANDSYYGGKPQIKNVTLRIIASADTTKVALQKGEVDASFVLPSDIADLDAKTITTYPYSENRIGYLGLNTQTDNLKDVKVRQAVLYALDKAELDKAAYLDSQYYEEPVSILPPANPFATKDVEAYQTDTNKAAALLKEAGVSDLKLTLGFSSSDPAQTIQATLIQQQLQKAGITVDLQGGDGTAIFAELKKAGSTKYDLFLGGYIMGNDPDLYSALFKSGGSANYFQYASATTDELFEKGAAELDETKRKEIYNQLQGQIAEDAVIYPIVDNKKILAVNNRITDVEKAGLIPIYTFEDLSKLAIK